MYPSGSRGNLTSRYERYSSLSEIFGIVLLLGLVVELIFAFILDKLWLETVSTAAADVLVVVGVWGELLFSRKARIVGDSLQAEANARVAEADASFAGAMLATAQVGRLNAISSQSVLTIMEQLALSLGFVQLSAVSEAARVLSIIPKITQFANTPFSACVTSSDIELTRFLGSFRHSLKGAGWAEVNPDDVGTTRESNVSGPAFVKVLLDRSKSSDLWDAAQTLASALNALDIEAIAAEAPAPEGGNANAIHIQVCAKTQ